MMSSHPNDVRLLITVNENGPQTFSELVNDTKLNLSRNTVNKYIKLLREKKWISYKYEKDKKLNYITTEGKIQVEKILGKKDLIHQLRAYALIEKKIKNLADDFLKQFGELGNSILMDCVENFIQFEQFNFELPNNEFKSYLAYFLARYNIQYCKSEVWQKIQPPVVQFSQEEFYKHFNIDSIEIKHYCNEWSKIKQINTILDDKDQIWFLSPDSLMYILMMEQIMFRVRRGTLQELLFENFIFDISEEASFILNEQRLGLQLELDMAQLMQLQNFIHRLIKVFLKREIGYSAPWENLPTDRESLELMSIELEEELNTVENDSPRKLEIFRTLHYISAHLKNHEEALHWGKEYLKQNPKDLGMLTIMAAYYYSLKRYPEFLKYAEKIRQDFGYDVLILHSLIKYYLEVELNLEKATELIEDAEERILNTHNLMTLYPPILTLKARAYLLLKDLEAATYYAERAWFEYGAREHTLFKIITDLYKTTENWELLEDFCKRAYLENEYNPLIFPDLYFAYLKRNSIIKAEYLYERVKRHYPDYLQKLEEIKEALLG